MRKIQEGVAKFQRETYPQKRELYERLAGGQQPGALFITCSDSRIVPDWITQTEPGDLFIIRNAGNIVPGADDGGGEVPTIEYAVRALKVPEIIVCGHSQCGAMSAVVNPALGEGLPFVARWLQQTQPVLERVRERHPDASDPELVDLLIQENVRTQLENLKQLPAVREALDAGQVNLHGWVYSIATGDVLHLQSTDDQFVALVERDSATLS